MGSYISEWFTSYFVSSSPSYSLHPICTKAEHSQQTNCCDLLHLYWSNAYSEDHSTRDKCETDYRYNYIYKVLPLDSRLLIMYHVFFCFFFVRYDLYGCEDLGGYRYSADHLFVPASCAMSNVPAMKTGVHWGKWYSFWAMPCNSTLMYCTCTINRQCAWVSFEATAEVYNEVNHASSNENANHLEHSSTAKVGC